MARELPTGTVTFLFADIEGSTRLLDELGAERYAEVLADHRHVFKNTIEGREGVVVDTQGDALFAAFASARDAVAAAEEIQRSLAVSPARVRMGVHTGEASAGPDGYVGMDVHRAARICAAAHGGQVLLSQSTRDLVDAPARDAGEHRLKDLTAPQRLHQLLVAGLPDEFPPLRTLERRPTNLPVQPSALIGRERELAEARELLERSRLLTLTGPGGTGKTRLAVQLAADVLDEYEDGVFFVDLADVGDPALVAPTVAQALGLKERAGLELGDLVTEYLAARRMLLLLDSVEHVVEAAPDVSRWLAAAPGSKLLTTSRVSLRLSGEQEYPVPPLPTHEAVELFAERARAVKPGFALDGDRAVVAEICARLDALPLAVELAAARAKLLPPPKLLERLEQRLPVLTGGARDAPARHRTLRAAIDWSFGLLEPEEQELFARLSVFAGGFTLEAAEAVCDATIDILGSLVDKSLVAEREAAGEARFSMLETVREYARERLDELGEADALARRHAEYFLSLAEEAAAGAPEEDPDRTGSLYYELENLRRALGWFCDCDDVEGELRFATAAFWGLWTRASLRELKAWLLGALERGAGADSRLRAGALGAAALAAANLGERELGREYARESLVLARELGDKRQIEWALRVLSFDEPDLEKRRRLLDECEQLLRELGNDSGIGWITYLRGAALMEERKFDEARETHEEAAAIFTGLGRRWEAANAELAAAFALIAAGRHATARAVLERSLEAGIELDSFALRAEALVGFAAALVDSDPGTATSILAAAETMADQGGQALFWDRFEEAVLRTARERLGERFESEWEAGRALSLEEAVRLARGEGP